MTTHTRTETHEERAWRFALESTDPVLTEAQRDAKQVELIDFLSNTPEESKKRIVGAVRRLTFSPDLRGVMPDVW